MTEKFANKVTTTLNGAITNSDLSLVVSSATGFPTSGDFRIIIAAEGANTDEICTVTAVSGTTFTITRATEAVAGSQAASAHGNGATISHVLTAGALTSFASLINISPSSDTYIDSQAATTNNDTATELTIGGDPADTTFSRRALFTFDTSTLASRTVLLASLRLFRTNTNSNALQAGTQLIGFRVLRAYNASQVTWNVYSTGNNWTTAGARSAGNDVASNRHNLKAMGTSTADVNCWYDLDITTLLKESLDASETTFRILIHFNEVDTAQNATAWASLNNGTAANRPIMSVLFQ